MLYGFLYFAISAVAALVVRWAAAHMDKSGRKPDPTLCAVAGLAWFITLPVLALTAIVAYANDDWSAP